MRWWGFSHATPLSGYSDLRRTRFVAHHQDRTRLLRQARYDPKYSAQAIAAKET
jgi:hypothetical protein